MVKKSCIKKFKLFLELFDYFGLKFHFHYKSNYNYRSATGGLTFIIFILFSCIYIIIEGLDFTKRNNMTLIYNDRQIEKTKNISFSNYSNIFAFGISCGNEEMNNKLLKYISIDVSYIIKSKKDGITQKDTKQISYSYCKKSDFYNKFNQTYIDNSLNLLYCPSDLNNIITGTFTENIFSYYNINFSFNCNNEDCFEEITNLLHYDECQVILFYIDTFVNINDYKNPIKQFLSEQFLILKPDEHSKMNLYFKVKSFDSYENYIFDSHKTQYFLGYSSHEIYSIKKGYNRYSNKDNIKDYNKLATIYLRSASIYTVIERKYMKLTEFAAEITSLISTVLLILYIIMYHINIFLGYQSVIQKIFQFKGKIKLSKNINEMKIKFNEYKETILKENNKTNIIPYNTNINRNINNNNNHINNNFIIINDNNINFSKVENSEIQLNDKNSHQTSKLMDNKHIINFKTNENLKTQSNKNNNKDSINDIVKINNNIVFSSIKHNCYEMIIYFICPYCAFKKLKEKNILFKKGKKQLFFQLDIITYLRKVQQIELLNYILLDPGKKIILDFLSKPLISYNKENNFYNKIALGYSNNITENEIENFIKYYKDLFCKENKDNIEKRLFKLSKIYIKSFIKDSNEK